MDNIDRQIADNIAKANKLSIAKLGLRFDKVVVRLFRTLRVSVEQTAPKGKCVLLTMTAPIKLPSKTEKELIGYIQDMFDSRHQDNTLTVFQNKIRVRIIKTSPKQALKFIGFVHNPGTDTELLLELATQWLDKI